MNIDLISAIIFYALLVLFFLIKRKRFDVQGKIFVLYKTKLGLNLMDKLAKKIPKLLKIVSFIGIIVGFLGMIVILGFLVYGTYQLFTVPDAKPVLAPVFPGIHIPGAPVLSFWHWIIALFVVAGIHEFSHGVISRVYNIDIKSSGFAFLGPILAAFVEPDEKTLKKKKKVQQLSVFAAGPFSNILLGVVLLFVVPLIFNPIVNSYFGDSVWVYDMEKNSPVGLSGMEIGERILGVNDVGINNKSDFSFALDGLKEGDEIKIKTDKKEYNIVAVKDEKEDRGFLGIVINNIANVKEFKRVLWVLTLFFWLFVITVGVGLFNLLPLGPVDGGRMFYVLLGYFTKDEKKVAKIWGLVALMILILILVNMWPYILKLFLFLLKPFRLLFGV